MAKSIFAKSLYFLVVAFFFIIFPTLVAVSVSASVGTGEYYYDSPAKGTINIVSQSGSSTIINLSDQKIFIPNKTEGEWDNLSNKAPSYVTVSTCGDGKCTAGEAKTCSVDCIPKGYCGDGICAQSFEIIKYDPPLITPNGYDRICKKKLNGWYFLHPVAMLIGFISGDITKTVCNDVQKTIETKEARILKGEVYRKDSDPNIAKDQTECRDDCQAPAGSGCGVCGYDSSGAQCPNHCSNGGYNQIDCVYKPAQTITTGTDCDLGPLQPLVRFDFNVKKYFTASEATAALDPTAQDYRCADQTYTLPARYECSFSGDTSRLCAAGKFCPATGGLIPTGQKFSVPSGFAVKEFPSSECFYGGNSLHICNTTMNCPPGHFCKVGSIFPRNCPVNTYSTGGADVCTPCPKGTIAPEESTGINSCIAAIISGDDVCSVEAGENPSNSEDCPDATQVGILWANDGRCSGAETMNNSNDCKCGDGDCNNFESVLSCPQDCACTDDVCGTGLYKNGRWTYYNEGKYCKVYGKQVLNNSICKNMNAGEVCGNKICEPGERYNPSLGKIVCYDCMWEDYCGDGSCTGTETRTSCPTDCKCGDGTCQSNESTWSCPEDCHCGNGRCETQYGETPSNCSSDCRCGDNVCSLGETCTSDCFTCNYNGTCDPSEGSSCRDCDQMPIMPEI